MSNYFTLFTSDLKKKNYLKNLWRFEVKWALQVFNIIIEKKFDIIDTFNQHYKNHHIQPNSTKTVSHDIIFYSKLFLQF